MSMMKHLPARVHAIQCEHVQQLALKSEFMHLSFDHLCQLLGSSDLNMACELQVSIQHLVGKYMLSVCQLVGN